MKVLAIKLSSMGDLFHALPAVHNLKAGLDAEIDWVVNREYADLVKCFTDVGRVIPFYRKSFFQNLSSFLGELRADEYEYVVDFQGLLKSAMVARLARGKRRIGPSFHREGAGIFYSEVAGKTNKERHSVEECMDVVRYLGLKEVNVEFPVKFPETILREKWPRIAVVPSSRWPTKNWPAKCFADVIKKIRDNIEVSVFLLGGPDDVENCFEIENLLGGGVVNMAGKTGLAETGGYLKEMDLLISNDSGPVHMAAAVGTPALVVFGPTDPVRTGPYGAKHRVVKTALPCQPCFSRACHRDGIPCLSGVTPERVACVAIEMLEKK